MLSRVAEPLYWMSRYLERVEDVARIIAVNFQASLDAPGVSQQLAWEPVIAMTDAGAMFGELYDVCNAANVTDFLTRHPENPNAILSCISRARENARAVREQISREMWEELNRLYHLVNGVNSDTLVRDPYDFFSQIRNGSHTFQGVTDATMSHGEGWEFIRAGKFLERADKTARILDVKYSALASNGHNGASAPLVSLQWIALLRTCSAFEPYRRSHSQLHPWRVVDFLLLDQEFPRSVAFCLEQTRASLLRISDSPPERPANQAERVLGRLCAELMYLDIRDALSNLHDYLDDMLSKINAVGDALAQSYFVPSMALPGASSRDRYREAQQQQQQLAVF